MRLWKDAWSWPQNLTMLGHCRNQAKSWMPTRNSQSSFLLECGCRDVYGPPAITRLAKRGLGRVRISYKARKFRAFVEYNMVIIQVECYFCCCRYLDLYPGQRNEKDVRVKKRGANWGSWDLWHLFLVFATTVSARFPSYFQGNCVY